MDKRLYDRFVLADGVGQLRRERVGGKHGGQHGGKPQHRGDETAIQAKQKADAHNAQNDIVYYVQGRTSSLFP